VQIGDGNVQVNNTFPVTTWTDGVTLPQMAGVPWEVASPYQGLGSFGEWGAAFFSRQGDAAAKVLRRMLRVALGPQTRSEA
jgi:hypothetical protein